MLSHGITRTSPPLGGQSRGDRSLDSTHGCWLAAALQQTHHRLCHAMAKKKTSPQRYFLAEGCFHPGMGPDDTTEALPPSCKLALTDLRAIRSPLVNAERPCPAATPWSRPPPGGHVSQ